MEQEKTERKGSSLIKSVIEESKKNTVGINSFPYFTFGDESSLRIFANLL